MRKLYIIFFILFITSIEYVHAQLTFVEAITTSVSCNGGNDGSVLIRISGGKAPYNYTIFRGAVFYSNTAVMDTFYTFSGIESNVWHIIVEDDLGDGFTQWNAASVSQPDPLSITQELISPITCTGFDDGQVSITAAGGSGNYSFELNPGTITSASGSYSPLGPGNYTITVTDNTCLTNISSNTLSLVDPLPLSISSQIKSDVNCFGGNDGIVTVNAIGGTGIYTYTLNPGATQINNDGIFTNLSIGTYDVEVSDENNCPSAISLPLDINQPSLLTIDSESSVNINCNGNNDGSINVIANGGTPPYIYTLNPGSLTQSSGNFTLLSSSNYTVSVSDSKSCGPVVSSSFNIIEPEIISIISTNYTDISCHNFNDGTIVINASGGTAPLTYTLNPGAIQVNNDGNFSSLPNGVYTVSISDANACSEIVSSLITIVNPEAISITSESKADINCNGMADGSLSILATGGTGSLHYTLEPGTITQSDNGNFNNLSANIYTVSISDDNVCPAITSSNLEVTEPPVLEINTESSVNIGCNGSNDGSINVTASGGTPPYSYTLNPGSLTQASGNFTGLASGNYTVTLNDSKSCGPVVSSNFNITEPEIISISSTNYTDISCHNFNDGTIAISASGGTAPLTYTLNPGAIQINNDGNFSFLSTGTYTVNISDANACPGVDSSPVTIVNPDAISISSESITDISCNSGTDGSLNVLATGGTGSLHYTLEPGTLTQTDNGSFTNLTANTYNISISDDNSCPAITSTNLEVKEPSALSLPSVAFSNVSCHNAADATINVSAAGGNGSYSYELNPGAITNASGTFLNLQPGTYSITVTDINLCTTTFADIITITQPDVLELSLSKSDIDCNGDANGTITVTAKGGTLPYEYSRNGITYQGSNIFTNLTQNTYTIWLRDINGCATSENINIEEPSLLQVKSELRVDNNKCFGDSLGEIRILSVEGGTIPYLYSIDGGINFVSTSDFQNIPAGDYQVMVKDINNCNDAGSLLHISQPKDILINSFAKLDVSDCFGNSNGQIAIEGKGGSGQKTYSLNGGDTNTTGIFSSVSGGSHLISIQDTNYCFHDTTIIITEPDEIVLTSVTINDIISCPGDNSGSINISTTGGTGVLQYAIDSDGFGASTNFSSLIAGEHIIHVSDANNCQIDSTVFITEPSPINIDTETNTDASCAGLTDGSVSISVSGGTPPYNFTLNPSGTSNTTGTFSSLPTGSYSISVNDANLCGPVTSGMLIISEPAAIIVDSIVSKDIRCAGTDDAEIHFYLSGGTEPYQYSINDELSYQSISDYTSLSPGQYRLSVKDAMGCSMAVDTISFIDPLPLSIVKETSSDISTCFGDPTGIIDFEVAGGTGSPEYSIDNRISWHATGFHDTLIAGTYTTIARDQNNCELSSSPTNINQPVEISADLSSSPAREALNLGSITISNANGGTGSLEFSIYGNAGPFSSQTDYNDLNAGIYEIVIRDASGCTHNDNIEVIQIQALDVSLSITHPSCNKSDDAIIEMIANDPVGQAEYSIDDSTSWSVNGLFVNLSPGVYYAFVKDEDGRYYADTITINEPMALGVFANITPASCSNLSEDGAIDITVNGSVGVVSYLWNTGATSEDLSMLNAGKYWVDAIDENLCFVSDTIEIPALTTVTADAGKDTSICFGETIILEGSGGTSISWSPDAGLSNPNIANPIVDSDTSISYYLTVSGMNNCYDVDTINITVFPHRGLSAGNDTTVIKDQTLTLNTTGGPYLSYLWEPEAGVNDITSANPVISPVVSSNYIVSALTDEGCYDKDTIQITLIDNLIIYNAFSPNNDDINDFWDIENAAFYPDIIVEIYNRWGTKFFSSRGYTDDKRWNGTHKGKDVPVGTYYYVVIPYNGATALTGPVTIVR